MKRSRFLAYILSQAVSEVRVDSVEVVESVRGRYWLLVKPSHGYYWERFKRVYPQWKRVVCKYEALGASLIPSGNCPEFTSLENLLDWLFDVLNVSKGERNLLQLREGGV